jgi:hypothetical protein
MRSDFIVFAPKGREGALSPDEINCGDGSFPP